MGQILSHSEVESVLSALDFDSIPTKQTLTTADCEPPDLVAVPASASQGGQQLTSKSSSAVVAFVANHPLIVTKNTPKSDWR